MERFIRKNRKGVIHFFELNVRDFRPIFTEDCFARLVIHEFRRFCDSHPAKLIAYVVMPTHMHGMINPRDGDAIRFLKNFKAAVTIAVDNLANNQNRQDIRDWLAHTSDGHRQLWQDGKHDFFLWSERLIYQKMDYIHNNPLKAGLAQHANEYPYSSFNARYGTPGEVIIPVDMEFWWEDLDLEDSGN